MHLNAEVAMIKCGVERAVAVRTWQFVRTGIVKGKRAVIAEETDVLDGPAGRLSLNGKQTFSRRYVYTFAHESKDWVEGVPGFSRQTEPE